MFGGHLFATQCVVQVIPRFTDYCLKVRVHLLKILYFYLSFAYINLLKLTWFNVKTFYNIVVGESNILEFTVEDIATRS